MVVSFVGGNPDTTSATAGTNRLVIGSESHHVIVGTEHFSLNCRVMIEIVDISQSRVVFLRSMSAYFAVGLRRTHGVEHERISPIAGIVDILYLVQRQTKVN